MTPLFSSPIYKYGDKYVDNVVFANSLNKSSDFLASRIGTEGIYQFSSEEKYLYSIKQCIEESLEKNNIYFHQIGAIIVVGQSKILDVIPHTAARVHGLCDFPQDCLSFDIGHGCAGFIVGLDIAQSYSRSTSKICLLITADPYRCIVNPEDHATSLLFSDAVAVSIVGELPSGFSVSEFAHFSHSNMWDSIHLKNNSYLHMNGRHILDFGKRTVAPLLSTYIQNHFSSNNTLVVPHHGSKAVVDSLGRATAHCAEVLWDSSFCGNTVSSSIPIVISNCEEQLASVDKFVMIGFGVGLSTSIATADFND